MTTPELQAAAFEKYGAKLLRAAAYYARKLDDAQEFVSDMWVLALSKWDQCRNPDRRYQWLYSILLNLIRTYKRTLKNQVIHFDIDNLVAAKEHYMGPGQIHARVILDDMDRRILKPKDRILISYLQGDPIPEGRRGAVKVEMCRMRKRIARRYAGLRRL